MKRIILKTQCVFEKLLLKILTTRGESQVKNITKD